MTTREGESANEQGFGEVVGRIDPFAERVNPFGFGGGSVTILGSRHLEWFFDRDTGEWYASYKMPGTEQRVFFNATSIQMDEIFGTDRRPVNFTARRFKAMSRDQTFMGSIVEMSGEGRFEDEVRRVTELALDEGQLPSWARRDREVMNLVFIAHTEGKSNEWLIENISKTEGFKTRFGGGIDTLKKQGNLTTAQAIEGFLTFEAGVKQALLDAGMTRRVRPELINDLLTRGQSLEDVAFVFDSFRRLQSNKGALRAFNQVLRERGLEPLGTKDQLAFLEGKSSQQLYQIWEEASFNQAAKEAGLNLSPREAMRLARRTAGFTSFEAASKGLQQAAQSLLRFSADIDFDRYDIDREDIIDMSVGLAPRSGRLQAEVSRNMERAFNAARAGTDGPRATRFHGFTQEGVPQGISTTRSRTAS
jgi:hypothetical protein